MYQPNTIDSSDRGFNYGDGFFTTMLVRQGRIEHFELHQQRILDCQEQLGFPPLPQKVWNDVLFATQNLVNCALKLVVTRGSGGRGYSPGQSKGVNWVISSHALPPHQQLWQQKGVVVDYSPVALASGGFSSHLKTLNRIEQVRLKQIAESMLVDELVCFDINEQVVEGIAANIFWIKDQVVYTPDLSLAGIHGVKRAWLLRVLEQAGIDVQIGQFKRQNLEQADEVWFCNCLLGIVPVAQLGSRFYSQFRFCRWLQTQ